MYTCNNYFVHDLFLNLNKTAKTEGVRPENNVEMWSYGQTVKYSYICLVRVCY